MSYKACEICSAQREETESCPGCGATETFFFQYYNAERVKTDIRRRVKLIFDRDSQAYDAGLAAIHRFAVGHGISIEEAAVIHVKILRGELGV